MPSNKWSREELIIAFNLYCKIPFGKIHYSNPEIIKLSKVLGRTPSAISWKLVNFASLDPSLKRRNIAGASHISKLDKVIWDEFTNDWEKLGFESERLLAERTGKRIEEIAEIDVFDLPKQGIEREALVKTRVNQSFFRKTVLAAYGLECCITGLGIPTLLTASHIIPWSKDKVNRLNPRNGLCLNALHDRAFDRGFITVTPNFIVKVSPRIKKLSGDNAVYNLLLKYDGESIRKPIRFFPDVEFLKFHNDNVFKKK